MRESESEGEKRRTLLQFFFSPALFLLTQSIGTETKRRKEDDLFGRESWPRRPREIMKPKSKLMRSRPVSFISVFSVRRSNRNSSLFCSTKMENGLNFESHR